MLNHELKFIYHNKLRYRYFKKILRKNKFCVCYFNFIIDTIIKNTIIHTIKYYIVDLKHIIIILRFQNDRFTYHKD